TRLSGAMAPGGRAVGGRYAQSPGNTPARPAIARARGVRRAAQAPSFLKPCPFLPSPFVARRQASRYTFSSRPFIPLWSLSRERSAQELAVLRVMNLLLLACIICLSPAVASAADGPNWTRTEDVIYGRKFGVALTMDVFTP